jgi:hypothetical protein
MPDSQSDLFVVTQANSDKVSFELLFSSDKQVEILEVSGENTALVKLIGMTLEEFVERYENLLIEPNIHYRSSHN